jgi:hypothetical protein
VGCDDYARVELLSEFPSETGDMMHFCGIVVIRSDLSAYRLKIDAPVGHFSQFPRMLQIPA